MTGKIDARWAKAFSTEDETRVKTEFGNGLAYATELLGRHVFADKGWDIEIKLTGELGGNGTYWQFPHAKLKAMEADPDKATRVRAAIVHEFMHQFREEEDVAMFAELIYLREHGQLERIQDIQRYHDDPDAYPFFKKNYLWGYGQIAQALNVDPTGLADALQHLPIDQIRSVFRAYAQGILRQEGLLVEEERAA